MKKLQDGAIVEHAIASELLPAPRRPLTREWIAAARALSPHGFTV
jgi:hypothetical protein